MISDFFINSVFDNLKMMESESLKLNQNIKTQELSKEEVNKIKDKFEKNRDFFSNLLNGKISDNDIYSFERTKKCNNLLQDVDNIFLVMNNQILFDNNKLKYNDDNEEIYNYFSYKIIKEKIKTLDFEFSLKDINLFKNNDVSILTKLLDLDSENLIKKELLNKSIEENKDYKNKNYTDNEIKVMSEMSKYLIGNLNKDEIEVMKPILISGRFSSVSESETLRKAGYRTTEGYSQYLRGTQSIEGVSQSTTINSGYYANLAYQSCHEACHQSCHGSRSWR